VTAGKAQVDIWSEYSRIVEILLARCPIKQGQSGRKTYWKILPRRVVRTLESNNRRRTSGAGALNSYKILQVSRFTYRGITDEN
jgi:hypothetical protein